MGFLDRMVGDLIAESTGLPVRRLVRRAGAGKLLVVGGAVLAGALAVEQMQKKKAAQTPPLPPVPGTGAGTAPLPPLPPVPGTTPQLPAAGAPPPPPSPVEAPGRTDEEEVTLPPTLLFAVVRTMVAAALADGELDAREKQAIESRLEESGLAPEQVQRIHKDLVLPPSTGELAKMVSDRDERRTLFRFAALVTEADQQVSEVERRWLEQLAGALGIEAEERARLEEEVFGKAG
jgi:uncharacterized membrane protein YebE (DUF533 family)